MAKNHILRDYAKKTNGQLGDFTLHVADALTGNANFTTPPVTPAALTTQGNGFNAAVSVCVGSTPADTLNKNTLRDQLIVTLDTLATYVELTANNDPQKIMSSGFGLHLPAGLLLLHVGNASGVRLKYRDGGNQSGGMTTNAPFELTSTFKPA
ncbi:MAG: hypothetical protein ABSG87_00155 [Verrucomicrobiota bacterium]|jgi:hypothetical protein